jgi:hypothetical protein
MEVWRGDLQTCRRARAPPCPAFGAFSVVGIAACMPHTFTAPGRHCEPGHHAGPVDASTGPVKNHSPPTKTSGRRSHGLR